MFYIAFELQKMFISPQVIYIENPKLNFADM